MRELKRSERPRLIDRRHRATGVLVQDDRATVVFLTVCTRGRTRWLANELVHESLVEVWKAATHWRVGRYVLLPDHLHLFAAPGAYPSAESSLETWTRYWKGELTRRVDGRSKGWRWLAGAWDRRLRSDESYDSKWNYVRENPVRHGLVEHAEEWAYQGEVFTLHG